MNRLRNAIEVKDEIVGQDDSIVYCLSDYLLRTESVGCNNLHSQISGVHKPVRIQRDLPNHGVVRNHHGNRAEEDLDYVKVAGRESASCW